MYVYSTKVAIYFHLFTLAPEGPRISSVHLAIFVDKDLVSFELGNAILEVTEAEEELGVSKCSIV